MTAQDQEEFEAYLDACTPDQLRGVLEKEVTAGRSDYAKLARIAWAMRVGKPSNCPLCDLGYPVSKRV